MKKSILAIGILAATLSTGCTAREYNANSVNRVYNRNTHRIERHHNNYNTSGDYTLGTGSTNSYNTVTPTRRYSTENYNTTEANTRQSHATNNMQNRKIANNVNSTQNQTKRKHVAKNHKVNENNMQDANTYTNSPWGKPSSTDSTLPQSGNYSAKQRTNGTKLTM